MGKHGCVWRHVHSKDCHRCDVCARKAPRIYYPSDCNLSSLLLHGITCRETPHASKRNVSKLPMPCMTSPVLEAYSACLSVGNSAHDAVAASAKLLVEIEMLLDIIERFAWQNAWARPHHVSMALDAAAGTHAAVTNAGAREWLGRGCACTVASNCNTRTGH